MKSLLILVNDNDQEIGTEQKLVVHQQRLLHRAFSIFIYRKSGEYFELLLQRRNPKKYHSGGLWTNTCCGHPIPGQDISQAALQRLFEEMGIQDIALQKAGTFTYRASLGNGLWENEIDHVFVGQDSGKTFTPNPEEVSEFQWLELSQFLDRMKKNPQQFTAWVSQALTLALPQIVKG